MEVTNASAGTKLTDLAMVCSLERHSTENPGLPVEVSKIILKTTCISTWRKIGAKLLKVARVVHYRHHFCTVFQLFGAVLIEVQVCSRMACIQHSGLLNV